MKGKISLKDFIKEVKQDLIDAIDNENPFFEMEEVELEVSFSLDASAKAGAKFIVEAGASANATQTHKVKIKLLPIETGGSEADTLSSATPYRCGKRLSRVKMKKASKSASRRRGPGFR